jgi:hypothetical protein
MPPPSSVSKNNSSKEPAEAGVSACRFTRRYNPKDATRHSHRRPHLTSNTHLTVADVIQPSILLGEFRAQWITFESSELLRTAKSVDLEWKWASLWLNQYSYGLDGRDSIPGRDKRFVSTPQRPDRLWGPPSLLSNGYWGLIHRG